MIGNKIEPFKIWCQKVLPNVYDDSLSYYEYLCKMNEYLNEVINQINTLTEAEEDFQEAMNSAWETYKTNLTGEWTDYKDALDAVWAEYKDYIDNYFENLDVQEEINNKLDEMASDGTLDALLLPYFNAYKSEINGIVATQNGKIAVLEGRMDEFASLSEGSTTGDAELADIRVGANGVTYPSAGDAVRAQITNLQNPVDELNLILEYPYTFEGIISLNGTFLPQTGQPYRVTDFIPVSSKIFVGGTFGAIEAGFYHVYCYDENKVPIEGVVRFTTQSPPPAWFTLNANARYIRLQTTTSYTNTNSVYSYTGLIGKMNTECLNSKRISNEIQDANYVKCETKCANITGFDKVYQGYLIAISNIIPKNCYLDNVTFKSTMANSNYHYLLYVTMDSVVEKKFAITGDIINLNYAPKEAGFLVYARELAASSVPNAMYYKANVSSNDGFTPIRNFTMPISGTVNEGDNIAKRTFFTSNLNFIGCEITYYKRNEYCTNKNIAFLGDSITDGDTTVDTVYTSAKRPYPATVEAQLGCNAIKKGYSGYPISSVGQPNCILSVYQTIPSNTDFIFVFAGTNDYGLNVPIGTIADTTDVSFYGAVRVLIEGLLSNYPNAQFVFATPIHRAHETNNSVGAKLSDYVNVIKTVCAIYSVPVIDLYNESYFNYVSDVSKALLSDGLHPTQVGYDLLGKVIAKRVSNVII